MGCSNCGAENTGAAKFCVECGTELVRKCPKCGQAVPPNGKFCGECGTALTPPPADADRGTAKEIDGERRHLTILFCDLVGSTEIAAQLDAEQWHEIAAEYQRGAGEAVARFGGHVLKFLGDGLVVCFGYPKAMEDAAERAVRAGLAIVEETAKLDRRYGRDNIRLQVRVGIHSGSVVIAQGGGKDADMFGDAPNLAARVQTAAAPGSVVITAATHALVSGLFVVEDLKRHPLKGIAQPVHLYRVAAAGVARRRSFAGVALSPLVGRDDEMQIFERRWERAKENEGQLVLLTGEAGIGKTRLLEAFASRIKSDAHLWVACAGEELFSSTPFHAVIQLAQAVLGSADDEQPAERFIRLERALELSGVKRDEALPLIAELLGLPLAEDYPALKFSPELKRRRLFVALASWVFGAAKIQPLVIVVEDLHWADPTTVEWLQMLADQGAAVPLMLLCTARPEFRAPWPMRAHHSQLSLGRLTDKDTRKMIAALVARSGLLADVVEDVVRRTDGVPLFAEELARLMLDDGPRVNARQVPATLQDSLTARLDKLGPARDVAQIGAVIGREFSFGMLSAVSPMDDAALQAALARLADAELIQAQGFPPDSTYRFRHALIQDAAYDALLKTRRSELHAHVAQAIEERFPQIAELQPQLLARHWSDAGRVEPAIAAWIRSAKVADARSAFKEAEDAYRQALALLSTLPQTPARDARELEILTALIVVASSARSWSAPEVAQLSARAGELAEKAGDLMPLILQRFAATAAAVSAGEHRAHALAGQVLDLAGREGSDFALRCGYEAQIYSRYQASDYAGVEQYYELWLRLCERAGYGPFPGETVQTYNSAAVNAWHLGLSDTARERAARAVAFGRTSSNPVDLMSARDGEATLYRLLGEPARVEEAAAEALALTETHGLGHTHSVLSKLAWARAFRGDAAKSIAVMREAIAGMTADGQPRSALDVLLRLAQVLNFIGEHHEAFTAVDTFLKEDQDTRNTRPNGLNLRGELHLTFDRSEAAEHDFRESLELAHRIGTRFVELRAATSLARLMQARGEGAAARALVAPLTAAFTQGFDTSDVKNAKALLDELSVS